MEDRKMSNEIVKAKGTSLSVPNAAGATLTDMRTDSKKFPRLKYYKRDQAVFHMSKIVSQAFLYRGQAADQQNIQFIASALVDELLNDTQYGAGNISFAEIQVVVKRAILETDVFGISVASLYRIIMDYVKGEGHSIQRSIEEQREREYALGLRRSIAYTAMIQANAVELINKK